jgi:KaiC/GvpD/RAD55 family RecA-like ATPase
MKRIRTHTDGLDAILDGGIPEKHIVLVVGAPGSMKSSLAYSILHANAERGTKGLYVSLEQSRESLLHHITSMGFDHAAVKNSLSILDLANLRKRMGDGGSWMDLFRMYTQSIRTGFPYELLALDSLDALEVLAKFADHRREVFELFRWLRTLGVTSLVLGELPPARAAQYPDAFSRHREDYLADGIVHLKMEKRGDFEVQRRLRVVKMRGVKHDVGYHALVYENGFRVTDVLG